MSHSRISTEPLQHNSYRQPSLFISHGSPDLILTQTEASVFLRNLKQRLTGDICQPDAILVISAHWETPAPVVAITAAEHPETIHDFYGFPDELYRMHYPAPGAPDLAYSIQQHLITENIDARLHPSRGLDHGVWSPLAMIWPNAEIPVIQISLPRNMPEQIYWQLGLALRPFRCKNCLIIGSGSATHNLSALRMARSRHQPADPSATEFIHWLHQAVTQQDKAALLDYKNAPYGQWHHPTPEHFLPLLVAAGAGQGSEGQVLHDSYDYGFLSMASYIWQ